MDTILDLILNPKEKNNNVTVKKLIWTCAALMENCWLE